MINEKPKFPRSEAIEVAKELCAQLKPVCMPDRLKVCGSLRRGLTMVGDVEIVFVPKLAIRPKDLLFSEEIDLADELLERLLREGVLFKRLNKSGVSTWGKQNKLAVHHASGIPVDFFATTEFHWPITVVIRTGPAQFNIRLIQSAERNGYKLHAYSQGFTDLSTGDTVQATSEEHVFELCGCPYLPPVQRIK